MPCWMVRTQTVDMEKANPQILRDALKEMGATYVHLDQAGKYLTADIGPVRVIWRAGKLQIRAATDQEADRWIKAVKKEYTATAFKKAALRFGFKVKTAPNGKLKAVRRRIGR